MLAGPGRSCLHPGVPGRIRRQRKADWSLCLQACHACAAILRALISPWRRAVCLETRSRARELDQGSVGISERWWAPGLRWGCRELLLGRKGWAGGESSPGGLTLLPPSLRHRCPGRECIPILIPGMPAAGQRPLVSPSQAIKPTTMTLLPNLRCLGACHTAFYLYLQWK